MTHSERMSKLLIAGPKTHMQKAIDKLHELKILHVVDHHRSEELDIGSPAESSEKISEILVIIRSLASHLNVNLNMPVKEKTTYNLSQATSLAKKIQNKVNKYLDKRKAIDDDIRMNSQKIEDLTVLQHLPLNVESYKGYSSIQAFVGFGDLKEIQNTKIKHEIYHARINNKTLIALFASKADAEKIQDKLKDFSEISLENLKGLNGSPQKILETLSTKSKELATERQEVEKNLLSLKNQYADFLISQESILSTELEKAEAPLRCGTSKRFFVIRGFVPTGETKQVAAELHEATNNKISIRYDEVHKEEPIPIKLKNPAIRKPFEFFLNIYSLPSYKELDPTNIVFWTFPLLFGFILGDMGYGLLTLLLFFTLKKKFKTALLDIGIFASLGSLIFGALFGEVFGEEVIFGIHLPHILSRSHDVTQLLYLAIAVGIAHINLGLLVGFYNEAKHHGFLTAVYEKGSWAVLQAGVALLALSYTNTLPIPVWIGYAVAGLSVIMLYKGEGALALIEIPGIFSNILSYARLMAVGLSSVLIAILVNEFATKFFHQGGLMIIAGVALLILGHALNIALGLLGGFLHSLRLHYVEFFGKFYKGGGKEYVPFGTGG